MLSPRRSLVELHEIDPLEFLEVEVVKKDGARASHSGFSIVIRDWTAEELTLKLAFDVPLEISQGGRNDQIRIRVKTPQYFIGAATGQ